MLTSPRRSRSRTSGITLSRICLTLVTLPVETPATWAMSFRTSRRVSLVKFDDGKSLLLRQLLSTAAFSEVLL